MERTHPSGAAMQKAKQAREEVALARNAGV